MASPRRGQAIFGVLALLASGMALLNAVPTEAAEKAARSPAEASLVQAEDARFQAQIAKDVAAVSKGMADELIYTHANGRVQTKGEYLRALEGAASGPQSIESRDRFVRVFGNAGIIRGVRHVKAGEREMVDSYLAVYVKRAGRWELLAWQTSPDPAMAASPLPPPQR